MAGLTGRTPLRDGPPQLCALLLALESCIGLLGEQHRYRFAVAGDVHHLTTLGCVHKASQLSLGLRQGYRLCHGHDERF
jgi:hypothetical protein